ncbi:MAG TPA: class I SAM-dependent methyltransferase [Oligoflexia bacterium]|nr:class I SAM-dependent methyltransferase [Oligoflexia bacterium]HMP47820.1 class I SAM-dependent methyltransferase [Oligoflexia bacterium]
MIITEKFKSEIEQYHKNRRNTENSATKAGWKNRDAQETRFNQLFRSFELIDGDSILDVGCGLGDLFKYLKDKYCRTKFNYSGVDILFEMINFAENEYKDTIFQKIDSISEIESSDYIVASGIFNLKNSAGNDEWLNYIYETVSIMFNKSIKGISFNCLSSFSDSEFMKDELYYANPMQIFEFCAKNLSENLTLYHDYRQYDFTISIKKYALS